MERERERRGWGVLILYQAVTDALTLWWPQTG
uniref:Uncharacterized protein n=1 Tax=Arundo donax TaxID=35708 RepID=A0A0A8XVP9_ARUDO